MCSLRALVAEPSMFGRDLVEQVRADSRDEDRMVPVIVEKCIDAVDRVGELAAAAAAIFANSV